MDFCRSITRIPTYVNLDFIMIAYSLALLCIYGFCGRFKNSCAHTFGCEASTMSEQKFVKVKIAINDQTYADTKVAEKDLQEFESELDNLLKRFEMVTGC